MPVTCKTSDNFPSEWTLWWIFWAGTAPSHTKTILHVLRALSQDRCILQTCVMFWSMWGCHSAGPPTSFPWFLPCTLAAPHPAFCLALVSRKPKPGLSSAENQGCKRKLTAGNNCIKSKKQSSVGKRRDQFTSSLAAGNYFYSPRSHLQLHKWRKAFWIWIFLCPDGRRSLSLFKTFFCPYSSSQSGEMHTVGEEGDVMARKGRWWYVQGVWTLWCYPLGQIFHPVRTCLCVAKMVQKRI